MSIKDDAGVKKWTARLAELKVAVPDELTPQAMQALLESTSDNPLQQHAVAHLAIHAHTARLCARTEVIQQMGQNDPKSEQAAQ